MHHCRTKTRLRTMIRMSWILLTVLIPAGVLLVLFTFVSRTQAAQSGLPQQRFAVGPDADRLAQTAGRVQLMPGTPLAFIPDMGQWEPVGGGQPGFQVEVGGNTVRFTAEGVAIQVGTRDNRALVRLEFTGAGLPLTPAGEELQPGKAHYFSGAHAEDWIVDVPVYAGVRFENLYPGIDLQYTGTQAAGGQTGGQTGDQTGPACPGCPAGQVKSTFYVAPGADPGLIAVRYHGAERLQVDADGALRVVTPAGDFTEAAPVVFQMIGGRQVDVAAQYALQGNEVRFALGAYDPAYPLVIDPVLLFYTQVGSTQIYDAPYKVAYSQGAGHQDDVYFGASLKNGAGMVVRKYQAGTTLLWEAQLKGSDYDIFRDLLVTTDGRVVVVGGTLSGNFPTTPNAAAKNAGSFDGTLTWLDSSTGKIRYSTYLGGDGSDQIFAVAVDQHQNVYVTGWSYAFIGGAPFPTTPGAIISAPTAEGYYLFATKYNQTGGVVYSTLIHSVNQTYPEDIAVTQAGSVVVNDGTTLRHINATGTAYLSGGFNLAGYPEAFEIAQVGTTQRLYVTGMTDLPGFGASALDSTLDGVTDAFLAVLDLNFTLQFFTYIGGSGGEVGRDLAITPDGTVYVVGGTSSSDLPLLKPVKKTNLVGEDGFVSAIKPPMNGVAAQHLFSTYLGDLLGIGANDTLGDLALAPDGTLWMVHNTYANQQPTNAIQYINLVAFSPSDGINLRVQLDASPQQLPAGELVTYTLRVANFGNEDASNVVLTVPFPDVARYTVSSTDLPAACLLDSPPSGHQKLTCTWATMEAGRLPDMKLIFAPNQSGSYTTQASITGTGVGGQPDVYLADNTASVTVDVKAGLAVDLQGDVKAQAGEVVTYTIGVKNYGLEQYTEVIAQAQIDGPVAAVDKIRLPGTQVFSTTTTSGDKKLLRAFTHNQVFPVIHTPEGIKLALPIQVPEDAEGEFTLTVLISGEQVGTGGQDPDPGDNEKVLTVEIVEPGADLAVSIRPEPVTATAGAEVTYSLVITNNGGEDAKDVVITTTIGGENSKVQFRSQAGTDFDVATACTVALVSDTRATYTQVRQRCAVPGVVEADTVMQYTLTVVPTAFDGGAQKPEGLADLPYEAVITGKAGEVKEDGTFEYSDHPDPDASDNQKTGTQKVKTGADLRAMIRADQYQPQNEPFKIKFAVLNEGPEMAYQTVLSTVLPAKLTYTGTYQLTNHAHAVCQWDAGTRVFQCTQPYLGVNSELEVELTVKAADKEQITLRGTTQSEGTYSQLLGEPISNKDFDLGNNAAEKVIEIRDDAVLQIIVSADRSDGRKYVGTGDYQRFNLAFWNVGPKEAENVQLTMTLPNGGVFVEIEPDPGEKCALQNNDTQVVCTFAKIPKGEYPLLTTAQVVTAAPDEVPPDKLLKISLTATGDNVETPATGAAQIEVRGKTKLKITIDQVPNKLAGPIGTAELFTYTINIRNEGPRATAATTVTVAYKGGYVPQSISPSKIECTANPQNSQEVICRFAGLAVGESHHFKLVNQAPNDPGVVIMLATGTADLINANLPAATSTEVKNKVNVVVRLSDTPDPVSPGQVHTVTVRLENKGTETATGVYVIFGDGQIGTSTDRKKRDLVDFCKPYTGDRAALLKNAIWCTLANDLAPGQSFEFPLFLESPWLNPDETERRLLSVAYVGTKEANTNKEGALEFTTVRERADMQIAKISSEVTKIYKGGPAFDLTVEVVNKGPDKANQPTVNFTIPAEVVLDSSGAPAGWTCNLVGSGVNCTRATPLAKNAIQKFRFMLQVTKNFPDSALNVSVIVAATNDQDPADKNTETYGWKVGDGVDLVVLEITEEYDPAAPGDLIRYYSVKVNNLGPDKTASGAIILFRTDKLKILKLHHMDSQSLCSGSVTHCTIRDEWAKDNELIFNVEALVDPNAQDGETAWLEAELKLVDDEHMERDPSNNLKRETTTISEDANLVVSGGPAKPPYHAGNKLDFSGTVKNQGPNKATNVKLKFTLEQAEYIDKLAAGSVLCTTSQQPGKWEVECTQAELAKNAEQVFYLTFLLKPNAPKGLEIPYTITAESDMDDPDGASVAGRFTVDTLVELDVSPVIVLPSQPRLGEDIVITYKVVNFGPSDAQEVKLSLTLPGSFYFVRSNPVGATCSSYSAAPFVCTWPQPLPPNQALVLVFQHSPDDAGVFTIPGGFSTSTRERIPGNNSVTASYEVTSAADLALKLYVQSLVVHPNFINQVVVEYANHGPSEARQVAYVVEFSQPPDQISGLPPGCMPNSTTLVTCQLGNLKKGENGLLAFSIQASRAMKVSGFISSADPDPVVTNNQDSKTLSYAR